MMLKNGQMGGDQGCSSFLTSDMVLSNNSLIQNPDANVES